MNPTKEFRDYLISQGAALVGIAPTREYYELYNSLSDKLNTIVTAGAKYLTDKGYHAYAVRLSSLLTDAKRISHFLAFLSPLPTEFLHIPFRLFHPDPTVH